MPRVICWRGHMSLQASSGHYCTPRSNFGPYDAFEVGFPSVRPPPHWDRYKEGSGTYSKSIYAWVPLKDIEEFIDSMGGEMSDRMSAPIRMVWRIRLKINAFEQSMQKWSKENLTIPMLEDASKASKEMERVREG